MSGSWSMVVSEGLRFELHTVSSCDIPLLRPLCMSWLFQRRKLKSFHIVVEGFGNALSSTWKAWLRNNSTSLVSSGCTYKASISERDINTVIIASRGRKPTFLYKLGPLDTLLDLHFVREVLLAGEGLVQASSEVIIAQGIFSSEKQQFYAVSTQCLSE